MNYHCVPALEGLPDVLERQEIDFEIMYGGDLIMVKVGKADNILKAFNLRKAMLYVKKGDEYVSSGYTFI